MPISTCILTKKGQALLAKTPIGAEIPVTRWQFGTGVLPPEQLEADLTALVAPLQEFPISSRVNSGNKCTVLGQFMNTGMSEFVWEELGLWATDPDEGEILYAVGEARGNGELIEAGTVKFREFIFGMELTFDNTANVTAVIDSSLIFATLKDLEGYAKLGEDGKVLNSQLPEMNYDPAGSAAAVQGNLNAHTANRNNPHGVTASQTGALPLKGGTMTGPINMNGKSISNLPVPVAATDAARKQDVDAAKQIAAIAMPAGGFIWFAAASAPPGFLVCDGSAVSRTTYSALFSAIGTAFGKGNGSSTFALPNLIDCFIKGGKNIGSRSVGTSVDYARAGSEAMPYLSNILNPISSSGVNNVSVTSSGFYTGTGKRYYLQPPNVTMLPCIKY